MPDGYDADRHVIELYESLLKRPPHSDEIALWKRELLIHGPVEVFRAFLNSKEYLNKRVVSSLFAPGHFHSPVVDPTTVAEYYARSKSETLHDFSGIKIDIQSMLGFWNENISYFESSPFREDKNPDMRFYYRGGPFPWGDAITLRAMIFASRPRRIIEIGSGFSTACMLDSIDEANLPNVSLTCIEPYPDRLNSLLRADDTQRLTLITANVQDVAVEIFDTLESGDLLFIDSTHVLKTGSDVHHEFFHILPRLKPGVNIHFHDCQYPFEYPKEWVFDWNHSWNEVYALRAFLMYNEIFSVKFWSSCLAANFQAKLLADCPDLMRNPGSSIWLKKN